MPIKPRDLERLLQGKFDFVPAKGHSSDHRWYELRLPGLPPILTKVSHRKTEISDDLLGKIRRQLRVRNRFFREMVDCTKEREDYRQQVRKDPFPPFDVRL